MFLVPFIHSVSCPITYNVSEDGSKVIFLKDARRSRRLKQNLKGFPK